MHTRLLNNQIHRERRSVLCVFHVLFFSTLNIVWYIPMIPKICSGTAEHKFPNFLPWKWKELLLQIIYNSLKAEEFFEARNLNLKLNLTFIVRWNKFQLVFPPDTVQIQLSLSWTSRVELITAFANFRGKSRMTNCKVQYDELDVNCNDRDLNKREWPPWIYLWFELEVQNWRICFDAVLFTMLNNS